MGALAAVSPTTMMTTVGAGKQLAAGKRIGNALGEVSLRQQTSPWMSGLFFLGCTGFAYCFAEVLHELGHMLAVWIQGGTALRFYFHPVFPGYNVSSYVPDWQFLYLAGGWIGAPLGLLLALGLLKKPTAWRLPLYLTAAVGLLVTGMHQLSDPLRKVDSDWTFAIKYGFPPWIILVAGVLFVLAGALLRTYLLPLVGVGPKDGVKRRILVYLIGLLPWQVMVVTVLAATGRGPLIGFLAGLIPGLVWLVLEASLSRMLAVRGWGSRVPLIRISGGHLAWAWGLTATIVVLQLAFFW